LFETIRIGEKYLSMQISSHVISTQKKQDYYLCAARIGSRTT